MHLSPAEYVIKVFKGVRAAATAIGRDRSAIYKWKLPRDMGGCDGQIPGPARKAILSKARELDLDITSHDLDFGRSIIDEPYNGAR